MKVVQFILKDYKIIQHQFQYPDWEERLHGLGYIQEVEIGDDYEPIVFAQVYLAHRRRMHHKGQTLITSMSSQWTLLKRVTDEALEFIGAMGDTVEMREGFVFYLGLAQEQDWIALKDIRYKAKKLIEIYEAEKIVDNDPDPIGTDRMVEAYCKEMLKRTGYINVVKTAKDYIPFIKAAKLARERYITAPDYIRFLVEKWEWAGTLKPSQLCGDKTEEYLLDAVADLSKRPALFVKKVKKRKGKDRF